jgi:hypothetical protein
LLSEKLISNFGLWWLQKGQQYAWLPLAVRLPEPNTEFTKLINSSFTITLKYKKESLDNQAF